MSDYITLTRETVERAIAALKSCGHEATGAHYPMFDDEKVEKALSALAIETSGVLDMMREAKKKELEENQAHEAIVAKCLELDANPRKEVFLLYKNKNTFCLAWYSIRWGDIPYVARYCLVKYNSYFTSRAEVEAAKERALNKNLPGSTPVVDAEMYLKLTDAMGYDSGADGMEWSPEEWAEHLYLHYIATTEKSSEKK